MRYMGVLLVLSLPLVWGFVVVDMLAAMPRHEAFQFRLCGNAASLFSSHHSRCDE